MPLPLRIQPRCVPIRAATRQSNTQFAVTEKQEEDPGLFGQQIRAESCSLCLGTGLYMHHPILSQVSFCVHSFGRIVWALGFGVILCRYLLVCCCWPAKVLRFR